MVLPCRETDGPELLTIGQLAEAAGVGVETVRYYERRGLLADPPRTAAGYRQYSPADLWRLQFVRRAKRLGFTLAEIAEIVDGGGVGSAELVLAAAHAKIVALDAEVQELARTRARLEELVDLCRGGEVDDCVALRLVDP